MSRLQRLCSKILFDCLGFSVISTVEVPDKCVIALAPHTSNWDFILGILYAKSTGNDYSFLMKKEWFFWPVGIMMRRLGGIPVYRGRKMHSTDIIAERARLSREFRLCITPEGTRKANPDWKKGFYYIALKARLPILLYGLDYAKREIVCTKVVVPNGDVDADMEEIKQYFKDFKGRHPEKFLI